MNCVHSVDPTETTYHSMNVQNATQYCALHVGISGSAKDVAKIAAVSVLTGIQAHANTGKRSLKQ